MTEIFMPKAGMDMKREWLIRWLKEVGDPVEKDEPVMEIETDKITMELRLRFRDSAGENRGGRIPGCPCCR